VGVGGGARYTGFGNKLSVDQDVELLFESIATVKKKLELKRHEFSGTKRTVGLACQPTSRLQRRDSASALQRVRVIAPCLIIH
jgi:hypothetical protein